MKGIRLQVPHKAQAVLGKQERQKDHYNRKVQKLKEIEKSRIVNIFQAFTSVKTWKI